MRTKTGMGIAQTINVRTVQEFLDHVVDFLFVHVQPPFEVAPGFCAQGDKGATGVRVARVLLRPRVPHDAEELVAERSARLLVEGSFEGETVGVELAEEVA